jgi:hypothetical protein
LSICGQRKCRGKKSFTCFCQGWYRQTRKRLLGRIQRHRLGIFQQLGIFQIRAVWLHNFEGLFTVHCAWWRKIRQWNCIVNAAMPIAATAAATLFCQAMNGRQSMAHGRVAYDVSGSQDDQKSSRQLQPTNSVRARLHKQGREKIMMMSLGWIVWRWWWLVSLFNVLVYIMLCTLLFSCSSRTRGHQVSPWSLSFRYSKAGSIYCTQYCSTYCTILLYSCVLFYACTDNWLTRKKILHHYVGARDLSKTRLQNQHDKKK